MFVATNRKEEMTLMITKPNFKPGQNLRPNSFYNCTNM